jgi:hypothetical protein
MVYSFLLLVYFRPMNIANATKIPPKIKPWAKYTAPWISAIIAKPPSVWCSFRLLFPFSTLRHAHTIRSEGGRSLLGSKCRSRSFSKNEAITFVPRQSSTNHRPIPLHVFGFICQFPLQCVTGRKVGRVLIVFVRVWDLN